MSKLYLMLTQNKKKNPFKWHKRFHSLRETSSFSSSMLLSIFELQQVFKYRYLQNNIDVIRVHGPQKCILKWDAFTETFQDLPIQTQISKLVHIFFSRTLSVGQAYITISCIGMILKSIFFSHDSIKLYQKKCH